MKKLLFLIAAVSTMLVGCAKEEGDMTSPPATSTNSASGGTTSTNQ